MYLTDLMAKVCLKVITRIKTLGDELARYVRKFSDQKKATLGRGNFETVMLLRLS